jgi:Ni/Co efflux regulator RcnB
MKTLFTIVALSVALATPALSQTTDRATEQLAQYQPRSNGYDAYAQYQSRSPRAGRSINRRNDVYDSRGNYVGSDPDPRIRNQMRHDPEQGKD